jgi:hypothetical protein
MHFNFSLLGHPLFMTGTGIMYPEIWIQLDGTLQTMIM